MDTLDRVLAFAISFAILGLALALRKLTRSWATPACLFSGFWFLFSILPLLALYFVPVNPLALGYIFLACLAFSLPVLGTDWKAALQRNALLAPARRDYLGSPLIHAVFVASVVISTVFILLDLLVQGISLPEMVFNFFESSNTYLELRYEGDLKTNVFGQWGLIMAYLCVTFGGLVHAQTEAPGWRRLVLLMTMLPPVLVMLVQAAKGLFFLAIAIILGAHLIQRVLTDKRPHVDFAGLAGYAKYLVLALPLILLSFLARGLYALDDNDAVIDRLVGYLGSYAFLHLYAFSDWFSFVIGQPSSIRYETEPLSYGFYTFIALFKLLGSTKILPPGTYDEYFAYGNLSPGNIYTIFRGLIIDFGIPGSLLVLYFFGSVFNAAYKRMLSTLRPAFSVAIIFIFVQVLYSSYLVSALIYNTAYLVFVLTGLVLVANRHHVAARSARARPHPTATAARP
jgi:oligosaccharide repeat unit polymerase